MEYKGYEGLMEVDDDAGVIFGRVIGLRDVITFQGETVAEARQAFHDSVDDYLALCAERGEEPEKSYSGKFVVRVKPELHRLLAIKAEVAGMSLNGFLAKLLAETLPGRPEPMRRGAEPETAQRTGLKPSRKGAG
jgi:predicted HicB family RNase H-like nuclease